MVAIIRYIVVLCFALGIPLFAAGSGEYASLMNNLKRLEQRREELRERVDGVRVEYSQSADQAQKATLASRITNLEGEIFDVTSEINATQQRLKQVEPLDGGSAVADDEKIAPDGVSRSIAESSFVQSNLAAADLKTISEAESAEKSVEMLYKAQLKRLRELSSLSSGYNQAAGEQEALEIVAQFDSLSMVINDRSAELAQQWSAIYDNKLFTYNMLLELLGRKELIAESQEISRKGAASIAALGGNVADLAVVRYEYQKREMIAIESMIAKELKLTNVVNSLSRVSKELETAGVEGEIEPIVIKERLFIDYAPITFSSAQTYSKSNPIPATKIYQRGVVYRILYGGFKTLQSPTIFRGAKPLSVNNDGGFNYYYGGGYKSYREALVAQKESKARGFNRPEVVMWRDGVSRNLSRTPYPRGNYRVVVDNCEELPEGVDEIVTKFDRDVQITHVGADQYIIAPFADRMVAEDMIGEITEKYDLEIKVIE